MKKVLTCVFLTFLVCIGLTSHYAVLATDQVKVIMVSSASSYSGEITQETDTGTGGTSKDINPNDYKPQNTNTVQNANKLKKIGNVIIGVIRTVGSIVSVGVLIVLGIKYMAGSVEEKAEYKKAMMPYVLGAFLVFGITNFLGVIIDIAGLFE